MLAPRYLADLVRQEVPSFTTPGVSYLVRQDASGFWTCTCPDSICRQHECKHIVFVRDNRKAA